MIRRGVIAAVAVVLLPALVALAAQPQFWKIEGARDFLDGDLDGLAVDSEGRVRLAPANRLLFDTEAPAIWCLARDAKGALFAGTGNEGKVFRIDAGKGALFYDAPELEVHALTFGPDGKLYAGTSPDGKVYAIDAAGKAEAFYDPSDKYIWALAFDRQGNLFVATGAEAKIHRVDRQGKGQVILTSPETHITALAVGPTGEVLAGSSPGGIVYRIDSSLKVSVLHDSAYREVKALAFGPNGTVYAAVIDGRERDDAGRPPINPLATPMPVGLAPEGFSAEAVVIAQAPSSAPSPRASDTPARAGARGAVLLLSPTGEADTLWSSTDEMPFSLVNADEGIVVGTGPRGKVFGIKDDRSWTMLATFPGEQVTALVRNGTATSVAVSNPGKVFTLEPGSGTRGTFVSKVKDSETVSAWGRLRFSATAPTGSEIQIQTRAGNTKAPDTTWSEWSLPVSQRDGGEVGGGRARFLQVKATFIGKNGVTPILDSIQSAYLQRNLRPSVVSVTVNPPGEVFQKPIATTGEVEILGLEAGQGIEPRAGGSSAARPPLGFSPFGRRLYQRGIQTFTWRAEDPNGDQLIYDVSYRPVGDPTWRPLRKGLTEAVLAWDTSTVPNGRYVVRVTASDAPSNPENLALTGDKESVPFDVDNTPPTILATLVQRSPARVRVVVRDDSSLIRKAEYAVDGGRWQEVHPNDGINDSLEETYEIVPHDLTPGTHVLVVRASDLLGNIATARVEVSGPTGR